MKAKIIYKEEYFGSEGYAVEIFIDGEWELDSFYPLTNKEGNEEKDFVSFQIINKMAQLQDLGYKLIFK